MENINLDIINNATPDNLKSQGLAKLSKIILDKGQDISNNLIPQVKIYAEKLGIQNIGELNQIIPEICVSQEILESIAQQRNNLISKLNNIGKKLDTFTFSLGGLISFTDLTLNLVRTLSTLKTSISLGSKFLPTVPGAVVSSLSDLEDFKNKLVFTETGSPKLEKNQSIISSISLSVSIINLYIKKIVDMISIIDLVINKCSKNITLSSIDNNLIEISKIEFKNNEISNSEYKGFIIEIETIPYSPTVNRIRAIGKNQQGIILIKTELSFSTNPQTLINELKLIIDRDNLKAY